MSSTLSQKADLAISSGSCTFIWHAPGLQASHISTLKHDGLVHTSRWNQNNRVVVTAGVSGQLALNYVTGTVMGVLPPQHDSSLPVVNTVCFSKGSKFLATGCANGEIKVWNLKRQVCICSVYRQCKMEKQFDWLSWTTLSHCALCRMSGTSSKIIAKL